MLETMLPILQGIITCAKAMASFDSFRRKSKGEARALIEELKENLRLCYRVVEDAAPLKEVIPLFSTTVYDRLNQEGYNFNALKRPSIPAFQGIEKTDLASWPGKHAADLIENIYDKIKDLRSRHAFVPNGPLHRRRINNILKRILLVLRYAKY